MKTFLRLHLPRRGRCHCILITDAVRTVDGVVQTARKPRCIACNNCVLACPFGVPKMNSEFELMMKCDMCYDRTSVGKQPMCTTVCPSRALHYGTWEEIEHLRPRSAPHNRFLFGKQEVQTKVYMMVPREAQREYLDVAAALDNAPEEFPLRIVSDADLMLDNLYRSQYGGHGDFYAGGNHSRKSRA